MDALLLLYSDIPNRVCRRTPQRESPSITIRTSELKMEFVDPLRTSTINLPPAQEMDPDATTSSGSPINTNESRFTLRISPLLEITVYAELRTCACVCSSSLNCSQLLSLHGNRGVAL
jgi:hypothetical protein